MKIIRLVLLVVLSTAFTYSADLEIQIVGIKNRKGVIQITLFDQGEGFPAQYKKGKSYRSIENNSSSITVTFDSLKAGTYAVAVIHDANSNKKLDAGLFGIPKEGYGVSKNIHPKTRAPKFSECSFTLGDDNKSMVVTIKYP